MRTVWLTIVCLALVSVLATGKALMTPASPTVAALSADSSTVGIGDTGDTLSKADRLEINYARQEVSPPAAPQPAEPATAPPLASPGPQAPAKIISRHWRDPNAFSTAKDARPADAKKKSKTADRKRNQAAERSKSSEPAKPCARPGTIGDLLRAVNLSPACSS